MSNNTHNIPDEIVAEVDAVQSNVQKATVIYDVRDEASKAASTEGTSVANWYQEGDPVETPGRGVGVVPGVLTEPKPAPDSFDLSDIETLPQ